MEKNNTGSVYNRILFHEDFLGVPVSKYFCGWDSARKRSVTNPRKMYDEHMNQTEWNWGK